MGYEDVYKKSFEGKEQQTFALLSKFVEEFGQDGVYEDEEIKIVAQGLPTYDSTDCLFVVRIFGNLVFKYSKTLFFTVKEKDGDWMRFIENKYNEKRIGISFEELRKLYIADEIHIKEVDKEVNDIKERASMAERDNKILRDKINEIEEKNKELNRKNEELKNRIIKEETKQSYSLDYKRMVSFLFSNLRNLEELENRHKILRRLFHPDTFHSGSELFTMVDAIYDERKRCMY